MFDWCVELHSYVRYINMCMSKPVTLTAANRIAGLNFPQALEPVIHRDFHQSMKVIDPVRPYTPISTPASRETRSRLQSSRNKVSKFIILVDVLVTMHCRKRISCFWLKVL